MLLADSTSCPIHRLTQSEKNLTLMGSKVFLVLFVVIVLLMTGCGTHTGSTSASAPNPSGSAVTISSVTPDSAQLAAPVTVQVTGAGFDGSSVIMLGGKSVATTLVNSMTVNTTLPANTATQPTEVTVAVSNTSSNLVSNALKFNWVAPLVITSTTLAPATQGSSYQTTLAATGGVAPYNWAAKSGLPSGLTMSSSGTISGIPISSGNYSISTTVSDSSSPAMSSPATLDLQVTPATLKIPSAALPSGRVSKTYSGTLSATGGTSPYTWSVSSGSLPPGLSLGTATGAISGTPTSSGTSNFTVSVSDSSNPVQKQSASTSIVIAAAPVPQLAIGSSALPSGTVSKAYSGTLGATGGTSPYKWSVSSGSLPTGLSLASATGAISGTPTSSGTFNFTVSVSDSGSPVQSQSAATSIVTVPALQITTAALPNGVEGAPYNATVSATGGTPPYTWSLGSGSFPSSLALAATSGSINGTPSTWGTFTPTVQVTDSANSAVSQSYSFTISALYSVLLDWTASPSEAVTGYNVYRSITNGSGYAKINPSSVGGTSYTDSTVVDGQIYYYVVTWLDATGHESAYSEDVQMTIPLMS